MATVKTPHYRRPACAPEMRYGGVGGKQPPRMQSEPRKCKIKAYVSYVCDAITFCPPFERCLTFAETAELLNNLTVTFLLGFSHLNIQSPHHHHPRPTGAKKRIVWKTSIYQPWLVM